MVGIPYFEQAGAAPFGLCMSAKNDAPCVCSLASVETPLSFAEISGLIEIYARAEPVERYERLLGQMHDCSGA